VEERVANARSFRVAQGAAKNVADLPSLREQKPALIEITDHSSRSSGNPPEDEARSH
jgi:hypothetical protein